MAILLFVCAVLTCFTSAQTLSTSRGDNTRSGANTNETLLTPLNVNSNNFGHLFSAPTDYQALAQPLYIPQVNISGQGLHNVVYVVTQADSVYAFDADTGAQLWHVSMTNGGVPASGHDLPCAHEDGFDQEGIVGTPVIDANTMYLVAKSVINGQVTHYLHALDITTGAEQTSMGSPVQIIASSVSKQGHVTNFDSLHQKNRPGALLLNGVLYLGFGSNGCNDGNTGWLLAYSATNLQQQIGAFNTSPDHGLTSIWQTGNGIAADESGNIFVATAESHSYDVPSGGQSYSNSVLKITPPPWNPQNEPDQPADYFTPWSVAYLNSHDLDVSSVGPVVLPDQPGNYPHELIASGKSAVAYLLNRDDMGQYVPGGQDNVIQEIQLVHAGELMCSPVYWNGVVYFSPDGAPLQAFQLSNGLLTPFAQSPGGLIGAHSPSISSNGTNDGVLWVLSGGELQAYDAVSLQQLYTSKQVLTRDKLPPLAHFATQTVANGKVYVATQNSLEAYGLFPTLTVTSGNNQSAPVLTTLSTPLQFVASDPYTGQLLGGVTVTFSDGNKGGTFNPPSAITDSTTGVVSTSYKFPKIAGVYALTASATNFGNVSATASATPLAASKIGYTGGGKQTGAAGSVLPNPIVAKVVDIYANRVPGVTVNFSANDGGITTPASPVTNAQGLASTSLQLPTTVGTITVTASVSGLRKVTVPEYSVAGSAASVAVSSGNNQTAASGTTLPQALSVLVTDQYGNPVSGAAVAFSDGGAGGSFANPNPADTNSSGAATQIYTLPSLPGTVTITANVAGVATPATFAETAQ